ncbi:hypothetical protein J2W49_003963 [Hydrogenophaga palleronii]|uniref:Avirulence protein n=1 Tax=Hydrogenophaga palleronii TaxID=65655 RepID=A0ABU1WSH2_9BURK|nr:hypothetical protein [Hydrogenophaga palleronii]MDR7151987.1 hypothetical protein [Hydrogenophaga palleronii]
MDNEQWGSLLNRRSDDLARELNSLQRPRQNVISPADQRLLGYTMGRAVDARPVEGADLERLRQCNETVEQTRSLLSLGRGNVAPDIQASGGASTRHAEAGRRVTGLAMQKHNLESFSMARAVSAIQAQAGNCNEHAVLATHLHAGELQPGETVHSATHKVADHAWAELRDQQEPQRHVVMDPWGFGPAVFAQDGEFTASRKRVKSQESYDAASGRRAYEAVVRASRHQPGVMGGEFQKALRSLGADYQYNQNKIFAPTPVISQAFSHRVLEKMAEPIDPAKLDATSRKAGTSKARGKQPLETAKAPDPEQLARQRELCNAINAVGVARRLGNGVMASVEMAPGIEDAARKLRG